MVQQRHPEPIDPSTIKQWPDDAVKQLQDYCERMGIIGFNSGRMHPLAALATEKAAVVLVETPLANAKAAVVLVDTPLAKV